MRAFRYLFIKLNDILDSVGAAMEFAKRLIKSIKEVPDD